MMTEIDWTDVLFCGWGDKEVAGVAWYRTLLPAKALGAECVIFDMQGQGSYRVGTRKDHKIIVMQHGWEHWQVRVLRNMKRSGAKVVINCDDWVPKVAKMGSDHALSWHFAKDDRVEEWKNIIREADAVLGSTPWLVDRLKNLNPNAFLARNGLDLPRYSQHRAPKTTPATVLGWAGGTGHEGSFQSIVPALTEVMDRNSEVRFLAVGDPVQRFLPEHLKDRTGFYKWTDMNLYPMNLAEFDINLAPAMDNDFFRAKSQLRFYEACAMGTPTVGSDLYSEIEAPHHHLNDRGYIARTPEQWVDRIEVLINAPTILNLFRNRCIDYCEEIDINTRISEWKSALTQLM